MNAPAPTRHDRRRLRTRQLLAQSTLDLILEKGYDAITIQDITERADLGRGTFYLHFRDKEEVVWTMFRESFEKLEQEAHRKIDRSTPQAEYYGLLNIYNHAANNRDVYRLMFGRQGSAMLTARVQDLLAETILYDIRTTPLPPDVDFHLPEEFEAQLLTGILSRLLFWWLETPNDYTAVQMAAMTYRAIYRREAPSVHAHRRPTTASPP